MVDTRPAAQRWRGSAVREPSARPLAAKSIDLAALSRHEAARAMERRRRVAGLVAALLAVAALTGAVAATAWLTHAFRGAPAAISGEQ